MFGKSKKNQQQPVDEMERFYLDQFFNNNKQPAPNQMNFFSMGKKPAGLFGKQNPQMQQMGMPQPQSMNGQPQMSPDYYDDQIFKNQNPQFQQTGMARPQNFMGNPIMNQEAVMGNTQPFQMQQANMSQSYMNEQMNRPQNVMNQQMNMPQNFMNEQMNMSQNFMNEQLNMSQSYMNEQMNPSQNFMNQQMNPSQNFMNQQMNPSQNFMNQQMNIPQNFMNEQMMNQNLFDPTRPSTYQDVEFQYSGQSLYQDDQPYSQHQNGFTQAQTMNQPYISEQQRPLTNVTPTSNFTLDEYSPNDAYFYQPNQFETGGYEDDYYTSQQMNPSFVSQQAPTDTLAITHHVAREETPYHLQVNTMAAPTQSMTSPQAYSQNSFPTDMQPGVQNRTVEGVIEEHDTQLLLINQRLIRIENMLKSQNNN